MKIVNFVKHETPIQISDIGKEIASFDIEFLCGEITLLWQGWSIRQFKEYDLVLQAAHMHPRTTRSKGTCVLIKGPTPHMILKEIRARIKERHGIEIPDPVKKADKTEAEVPISKSSEKPAPAATNRPRIGENALEALKIAERNVLRQIKDKGPKK